MYKDVFIISHDIIIVSEKIVCVFWRNMFCTHKGPAKFIVHNKLETSVQDIIHYHTRIRPPYFIMRKLEMFYYYF